MSEWGNQRHSNNELQYADTEVLYSPVIKKYVSKYVLNHINPSFFQL